ncbi:MAG: hypothetical protein RIS70_1155 [Planctomycetota bacterium]
MTHAGQPFEAWPASDAVRRLAVVWAWTALGAAGVTVCFLLGRRIGITMQPKNVLPVLISAAGVATLLVVVRQLRFSPFHCTAVRFYTACAPSLLALAGAVAFSFNLRTAVAAWLVLGAEEIWFWSRRLRRSERPPDRIESMTQTGLETVLERQPSLKQPSEASAFEASASQVSASQVSPAVLEADESSSSWEEAASLLAGISQQVERGNSEDGGEFVHATLRGQFAEGDRGLHLHLGFCPPLNSIPEVEFEQVAGPEVQIQLGQCQIYGLRLDLRLTRPPSESAEVVVAVSAKATA